MKIKVGKTYENKEQKNVKITGYKDGFFIGDDKLTYDKEGVCLSNIDWTAMYNLTKEMYIENPFLNENTRLEKMLSNYHKYGSLVIGVDFDFTLNCPISKHTYSDIVELLKKMQDKKYNFIFCVWTANTDREYVEKTWKENDLRIDYYNYSPINPSSIKPHFNILLDDSAGLNESCVLLKKIMIALA